MSLTPHAPIRTRWLSRERERGPGGGARGAERTRRAPPGKRKREPAGVAFGAGFAGAELELLGEG